MASVGHLAVGALIGCAYGGASNRERVAAVGGFAGLALLPDLDVAPVAFGVPDYGTFGHRGISHSLIFALALALTAALCARRWGRGPWFTGVLVFMAVASHGLLDAMTHTTRGIPFLWPIDADRSTFPWRPIPAAPTGLAFIGPHGLRVALIEVVYFVPVLLVLALWRPSSCGARSSLGVAVSRAAAIVAIVVACLGSAELFWRTSPLVAWIESGLHPSIAVHAIGH